MSSTITPGLSNSDRYWAEEGLNWLTHVWMLLVGCLSRGQPLECGTLFSSLNGDLMVCSVRPGNSEEDIWVFGISDVPQRQWFRPSSLPDRA